MECMYCGAELIQEDIYGLLFSHQSGEVMGEIFRCQNHEGFETEEAARAYDPEFPEDSDWMEIVCESSCHSVSGSFYTDRNGDLYAGYPC